MKKVLIIAIVALSFSFIAVITSFLRVEVYITHETFFGVIATLMGAMITFAVGFQVINYLVFEKKMKDTIKDEIESIKDKTEIEIKKIRLGMYRTLMRSSLSQNDWETFLDTINRATDDILNTEDKDTSAFIIESLTELCSENTIVLDNVFQETKEELKESLLKIQSLIISGQKQKLINIILPYFK